MIIDFKKCLYIFTIALAIFIQGCGSGGTVNSEGDNSKIESPNDENSGNESSEDENSGGENQNNTTSDKYKYNRISVAGSSVTWGNGLMGVGDYIGPVEEYFRESIATTIMPNSLNNNAVLINDPFCYKEQLYRYSTGAEISGSISGDEISIVFAAQRGASNVVVEMIVDGIPLGEKTITSSPVEHESKTFNGDGHTKSFDLGRVHTFNHTVSGYGAGYMVQGWTLAVDFSNSDWAIVRKGVNVDSGVHHFITFKNAPSGSFTVSYDYGENIKPVKSSIDNIQRDISSPIESAYGDKWTSNLDNNLTPTEGFDFRQNDERAVKTWSIGSDGNHNFTLKVKSGELLLNFITNHMYYFQNAGIGGTDAADLVANGKVAGTTDQIRVFDPDLFILESSTNDAAGPNNTNNWIQKNVSFTTSASNKIILQGTPPAILPGDIVVMGEYNGNINNIEVGIVSSWDSNSKVVTFTTDVPPTSVKTCDIKRIDAWEDRVKAVINKVTSNVSHNIQVGIATCGVPDLNKKHLMGYREKGKMLAAENNWMFFDFFEKTLGENWSGDNVHPNAIGHVLFGEAILDVLFP